MPSIDSLVDCTAELEEMTIKSFKTEKEKKDYKKLKQNIEEL